MNVRPFETNADYLEAQFRWLRARVGRLDGDATTGPPPGRRRAVQVPDGGYEDWAAREQLAATELRERLAAHAVAPKVPALGMDVVADDVGGLDEFEKLVLLATTAAATSETIADRALGPHATGLGSLTVSSLLTLAEPDGLAAVLDLRSYFAPGSKLRQAGLVDVDLGPDAAPGDLLGAWCSITAKGFKAMTGYEP